LALPPGSIFSLDDVIEYNKYVAEKIREVYWDHNPISPIPNGQEKSIIFLENYYTAVGIAQSTLDNMKTDLYTKTILTIIAICLLYIAGKDMVAPAYADRKKIIDVNIAKIDGQYLGRVPLSVKVVQE
jgi:hypothetical protein